jgi:hypothetical protein
MALTQVTSGLISSVANTAITGFITSSQISSVSNTSITGNIASSQLAPSGVSTGIYGGATAIPVITVNAQGQITNVSNTIVTSSGSGTVANGTMLLFSNTISANYTIATGNNALSVGPITLNSGNTITLASGQRWIII